MFYGIYDLSSWESTVIETLTLKDPNYGKGQ